MGKRTVRRIVPLHKFLKTRREKYTYRQELYLNVIANKSPYAMEKPGVDRLLSYLKRVDPNYYYITALGALNNQRRRPSFAKNDILRETFNNIFARFSLNNDIEKTRMIPDEPIEETLLHSRGTVVFIRNKNEGKLDLYDENNNFIKQITLHVAKEYEGRCLDLYKNLIVVYNDGKSGERRLNLL